MRSLSKFHKMFAQWPEQWWFSRGCWNSIWPVCPWERPELLFVGRRFVFLIKNREKCWINVTPACLLRSIVKFGSNSGLNSVSPNYCKIGATSVLTHWHCQLGLPSEQIAGYRTCFGHCWLYFYSFWKCSLNDLSSGSVVVIDTHCVLEKGCSLALHRRRSFWYLTKDGEKHWIKMLLKPALSRLLSSLALLQVWTMFLQIILSTKSVLSNCHGHLGLPPKQVAYWTCFCCRFSSVDHTVKMVRCDAVFVSSTGRPAGTWAPRW